MRKFEWDNMQVTVLTSGFLQAVYRLISSVILLLRLPSLIIGSVVYFFPHFFLFFFCLKKLKFFWLPLTERRNPWEKLFQF